MLDLDQAVVDGDLTHPVDVDVGDQLPVDFLAGLGPRQLDRQAALLAGSGESIYTKGYFTANLPKLLYVLRIN